MHSLDMRKLRLNECQSLDQFPLLALRVQRDEEVVKLAQLGLRLVHAVDEAPVLACR